MARKAARREACTGGSGVEASVAARRRRQGLGRHGQRARCTSVGSGLRVPYLTSSTGDAVVFTNTLLNACAGEYVVASGKNCNPRLDLTTSVSPDRKSL